MLLPIDYETLRLIWWGLMGILLIGFALTDGFDLGVAALLPFVAKTDAERRMVINSIGATWEGNQVWFILGGGAIFAAWPFVYAVSFSGFYLAMFLVLAALILRPVGFKYRSKRPDAAWRSRWDWALFVGGFVPALVFGVAVGNVLTGIPFRLDGDLRSFYEGSLLGLFHPFSLLAGLLSVAMLVLHGASWLAIKIERGTVHDRARRFGQIAAVLSILLFAVGGLMVARGGMGFRIDGYRRSDGAIQSASDVHDRHAGRMDEQLCAPSLDAGRAGAWFCRPPNCARRSPDGQGGAGIWGILDRNARHHRHGRPVNVPLHPAQLD